MLRNSVGVALVALLVIVVGTAHAATPRLDRWFLRATAYDTQGTAHAMARPDFFCGKTFETMDCHLTWLKNEAPNFYGVWELLIYDRKHQTALAHATTDQESFALFRAPAPAVSVPNADLSEWTTARGLQIGSPYSKVLSLYGGTQKHDQRFVVIYTASFPTVDEFTKRHETLDETVTLVVADDRVTSISINIPCCNP